MTSVTMRLFQIFIVLCLFTGFLDLSYSGASLLKKWIDERETSPTVAAIPGSLQDVLTVRPLPSHYTPGMGYSLNEFTSPDVNIDTRGMRSNGTEPPAHPRATAYLFGASQPFGYALRDSQTMASHLERALGDVTVKNYSAPGQRVPTNILRWQEVIQWSGVPDFAIFTDAGLTVMNDCILGEERKHERRSSIIQYIYETLKKEKKTYYCEDSHTLDQSINHAVYEIQSMVNYARSQNTPFMIVMLPNTFISSTNTSNLPNTPESDRQDKIMRPAIARYLERLKSLNYPELVDLSHSLPTDQPYFLDRHGHMSGKGNQIVAEAIAAAIHERSW